MLLNDDTPALPPSAPAAAPARYSSLNLLLLGLDSGDTDVLGSPRRSDTMIVARLDSRYNYIYLMSIPRDSRVILPGHSSYDKIGHAHAYGGPSLALRAAEQLLDISIDYYVALDWQSFISVVDILGGVSLNVEQAMDYEDPYDNLRIHLQPGLQHLDGQKAGQYVRFRHDEMGDIGRTERQQQFLSALTRQLLQPSSLARVPALVAAARQHLDTNLSAAALARLGQQLMALKQPALHTATLPGSFATIDGLSYWQPDQQQTKALINTMFKD